MGHPAPGRSLGAQRGGMAKIINDCNEALIGQVYVLLNENYVEDDDNMFRFDYRWARQ